MKMKMKVVVTLATGGPHAAGPNIIFIESMIYQNVYVQACIKASLYHAIGRSLDHQTLLQIQIQATTKSRRFGTFYVAWTTKRPKSRRLALSLHSRRLEV